MRELREALERATAGEWSFDGPPDNHIIWSSPENRVAFMAHSNGDDPERDTATAAAIVLAINTLRRPGALELLALLDGPDDATVERVARALCREGGFDPDEMMANDGPRWRYYEPGARAALAAVKEVNGGQ